MSAFCPTTTGTARWLLVMIVMASMRFSYCSAFCSTIKMMGVRGAERRPQRLKLFKARYPLEGAPPQLRLHVAVIVQSDISRSNQDGEAGGSLVLFDFLPKEPTALMTTTRLLSGGQVEGDLRERVLRYLPRGAVCVGETAATLEDMRHFVAGYPDRLSLVNNSCLTFVDAFIARHRMS